MPAIAIHNTETSGGAWDGPANEARLRTGETEAYYRRAYAWQDPDGNPETKAAYRFIHHEIGADGTVGPANLRAASTGIGVLNGGMGGTTIPASDRRGVYNHLAAHLRDADQEPSELQRATMAPIERRTFPVQDLRVDDQDRQPSRIRGYAAVFDSPSELLQDWLGRPFRETIARGAFTKTLKEADVRALWNHDPNYVLGRNRAGTLTLGEDIHGLVVEIQPPDTTWAGDLMQSIRRGDVSQMSFGFTVVKDAWESKETETGESIALRKLLEVRLYDVSAVTFPAYPATTVDVRAAMSQSEPVQVDHSEAQPVSEPIQTDHSIEDRRRRFELDKLLIEIEEY